MNKYLEILFDADDFVCPARNIYDVRTYKVEDLELGEQWQWISINSFLPYKQRKKKT